MQKAGIVAIGEIANDFVSLRPIVESGMICRFFAERLGFQAAVANEVMQTLQDEIADVLQAAPEKGLAEKVASAVVASAVIASEARQSGLLESGRLPRRFAPRNDIRINDTKINDIKSNDTRSDDSMCVISPQAPVTIHPAAHAPYSTSAELIQRLTALSELSTIHVAENKEEVELLADGSGPWRERLREIGKDDPQWSAPGLSPVQYLHSLGVLQKGLLLVHAVHVDETDIKLIAGSGATVVLCVSSNEYIGVGKPPVMEFVAQGVPLALGTDSLASSAELDMFTEMRKLRDMFPELSQRMICDMATIGGSSALGYEKSLGSLEIGKAPGVFAVDLSDAGRSLDFASDEDLFAALITVGAEGLRQLAPAKLQ